MNLLHARMAWKDRAPGCSVFAFLLVLFALACGGMALVHRGIGMAREKVRITSVEDDFPGIEKALRKFVGTTGLLPTQRQGLSALVKRPSDWPDEAPWVKVMEKTPDDPWGKPYRYTLTVISGKQMVTLRSAGEDGVFDTPDDLVKYSARYFKDPDDHP